MNTQVADCGHAARTRDAGACRCGRLRQTSGPHPARIGLANAGMGLEGLDGRRLRATWRLVRKLGTRLLRFATLVGLCAPLLAGCGAKIGDSCGSSTDCGSGRTCDLTQPGGYCTIGDCDPDKCPSDEAVCVRFDDGSSWCMKPCSSDSDCRSSYVCAPAAGASYAAPTSFCNAAAAPRTRPVLSNRTGDGARP